MEGWILVLVLIGGPEAGGVSSVMIPGYKTPMECHAAADIATSLAYMSRGGVEEKIEKPLRGNVVASGCVPGPGALRIKNENLREK